MPTVTYKSSTRAVSEHCNLVLHVRHRLVAGEPSDIMYDMKKTRFPENVDVLMATNLRLTLSGSLNGVEVSPQAVRDSRIASHLLEYLKMNSSELGLSITTDVNFGEAEGPPSLVLISSRQYAQVVMHSANLTLVGLDFKYVWKTTSLETIEDGIGELAQHPFSQQLSLPFLTLLDNAVGRFITWQLVRRYPLIFGPWREQLTVEVPLFAIILSSITNISRRSRNKSFRKRCAGLLKVIKRQVEASTSTTKTLLQEILDQHCQAPSSIDIASGMPDRDAFSISMERVYRCSMRQPLFKGLTCIPTDAHSVDEDLLIDSLPPPTSSSGPHSPSDISSASMGMKLTSTNEYETHDIIWSDAEDTDSIGLSLGFTAEYHLRNFNQPRSLETCRFEADLNSNSTGISSISDLDNHSLHDEISCSSDSDVADFRNISPSGTVYPILCDLYDTDFDSAAGSESDAQDISALELEHDRSADVYVSQAKERDRCVAIEMGVGSQDTGVQSPTSLHPLPSSADLLIALEHHNEDDALLCLQGSISPSYMVLQNTPPFQGNRILPLEELPLVPLQYVFNSNPSTFYDDWFDHDMLSNSGSENGTEIEHPIKSYEVEHYNKRDLEDEDRSLVPVPLITPTASDSHSSLSLLSRAFQPVKADDQVVKDLAELAVTQSMHVGRDSNTGEASTWEEEERDTFLVIEF